MIYPNKVIKKQFNNLPVEFNVDREEQLWVTAEQLGNALGYAEPRKGIVRIYERHKDLLQDFTSDVKLTTGAGTRVAKVFNETGCNIIAMKSNTPHAQEFVKWAAQVITDYRHGKLNKQKLPSAAFMRELSRVCGTNLARQYLKKELGLTESPAKIIRDALSQSKITLGILCQLVGWKESIATFLVAANEDKLPKETRFKVAAVLGLNLEDIWG